MRDTQSSLQRAAHARPAFGRAGAKISAANPRWVDAPPASPAPRNAPSVPQTDSGADRSDGFQTGRVFSRAFRGLAQNAVTFIALAALAAAPERIAVHVIGFDSKWAEPISSLMITLGSVALQPAVAKGLLESFNGRKATFGDCVSVAMSSFFPVVGIAVLSGLGIGAATFLAIVPGILLALSWSVAVPVRVAEGLGVMASLGRSRALCSGHRWKILLLFALILLLCVPIGLAMETIWGISPIGLIGFLADNWLVRLVFAIGGTACMTSLYHELCLIKEGGTAGQLAEVFD